jgi:pheromone shutdown protein TraB
MRTPDVSWLLAATGASSRWHRLPSPWWQHALIALRAPVWPAVVATLMAIGLLLAFQQVVAQSVAQGDLRRKATAEQVRGVWRCKLLRATRERDSCLAQLARAQDPISLPGQQVFVLTPMEK